VTETGKDKPDTTSSAQLNTSYRVASGPAPAPPLPNTTSLNVDLVPPHNRVLSRSSLESRKVVVAPRHIAEAIRILKINKDLQERGLG
jgi:hypothetical protein